MSRRQAPGKDLGNRFEPHKAFIEEVMIVYSVVEDTLLVDAPVKDVVYTGFVNIHKMKLAVIV